MISSIDLIVKKEHCNEEKIVIAGNIIEYKEELIQIYANTIDDINKIMNKKGFDKYIEVSNSLTECSDKIKIVLCRYKLLD